MLTGVQQGCLLSPMLFLLVIDWTMKSTLVGQRLGIQWTLTTYLEDLDFADDLTLMSHALTDMQKKVNRLAAASLKAGLSINRIKTEVTRVNNRCKGSVNLNGIPLNEVEKLTYLRSMVSKNSGSDRDIVARIGKAKAAFICIRPVWRSKLIGRRTKLCIFNTNVKSVLLLMALKPREQPKPPQERSRLS